MRSVLVVCLLALFLSAFGWLWLNNQCELGSARIKELEQQKIALRQRVANEEFKWSNMTTYENMMKLLKGHNVEMGWPQERQIVRIRRASGELASDTGFARN